MFAIINVPYFAYGGWFWAIKASGSGHIGGLPVARIPRPKCMTRRGFMRRTEPRVRTPVGKWSTWQQGLPDGRPDVELGPKSDRCATRKREWLNRAASSLTRRIEGDSGVRSSGGSHLYRKGWRAVAAMRLASTQVWNAPREAHWSGGDDDPRLIGVSLDLTDAASVTAAAKLIEEAVGAPIWLAHNAGISAAGNARRGAR